MNRQKSLAVLLCAAVLSACDYEKNAVQDITAPDPGSRIRFFNFGVNAPAVNFYANDTKVTGISTATCALPPASQTEPCTTTGAESTTGTGYGGVGLAGLYSALAPGQYTFTGRIAATIDKDLPISNVALSLTDGRYYSFYQSGFYDAAMKRVDAFVVEDLFPATIDYSVAHVRFVHAISNANPMTLYATNTTAPGETAIGAEAAYRGGGAFTALPGGIYNLATRYAGLTTNALTRTNVTFIAGRVYTITARGDITVAPTTTACGGTNRTCLDNTVNR
jgi:hypothetical protein